MIYVVFILIYSLGAAWTVIHAIMLDALLKKRVELKVGEARLPEPPKFRGYLSWYGLLWPLTMWLVTFYLWEEYIERKE